MRNGIQFPLGDNRYSSQVSKTTRKLEEIKTGSLPGIKDSFKDILQSELQKGKELKFSAHAANRLKDRELEISQKNMEKINTAVNKASDKGAKESLILLQDMALIVNIRNRTIITAMDKAQLQENVFTNIDSAIVI
ncbi:MAG: TIGR02530 family flagellar biosynthesis protein [bacterium]